MKVSYILTNALKHLKTNGPEILTAAAVGGVFTTAYLTVKATWEATRMISWTESHTGVHENPRERFKARAKEAWPLFVPPTLAGVATIGCIVCSSRSSAKRTAAAFAAYSLTERAFSEYKEKVVEQIGINKEQKIRDELTHNRVQKISTEVVILGSGPVLCCELYTDRYFKSDMETLRKAQNDVNELVNNIMYVSLSEFYDIIGLNYTSVSSNLGWNSEKLMELKFSSVLAPSGEPCLAFEYNYVKPLR